MIRGKLPTRLRGALCIATAALLSACANKPAAPLLTATQEAATYVAKAKPHYAPPGPPDDPWGPYITEAAQKYDVPERWVREVMRVESGAHLYNAQGGLITSPVGAMGLMQIMPETYDEVRARYALGDDAYDPHNNILAGTAYLRELYDAFGSPGFLAAYNGGPARLTDYLSHNRPLPAETRRYVAMIAPAIAGVWPQNRSPAEQYAINQLPMDIPAGPRYRRHSTVAIATRSRRGREQAVRYAAVDTRNTRHAGPAPVEVAEAPEPRTPMRLASAPAHHGGLHLISTAMASESPAYASNATWSIQVGAFGDAKQAEHAAGAARGAAGTARPAVTTLHSGHATLYRARLNGMSHDQAVKACHKLGHCVVVAPSAS
jgi:hypothetical protein